MDIEGGRIFLFLSLLAGNIAACRKQYDASFAVHIFYDVVWVALMKLNIMLTHSADGGSLIYINLCRERGCCIYL